MSRPTPFSKADADAAKQTQRELAHYLALHQAGDVVQAAAGYQAILQRDPECVDALHFLGVATFTQGELTQAEALYRRAITLRPNAAQFHYHLALLQHQKGDHQAALTSYRQTLTLDPRHGNALENIAVLLSKQKQHNESLVYLESALQLSPNSAQLWSNAAELLRAAEQLSRAEESARRAIQVDPNYATAYFNLAVILYKQGEVAESTQSARRAHDLVPDNAAWHSTLLHSLLYQDIDPKIIFAEHRRFAELHETASIDPRHWQNISDPQRRLRVGLVSPDLHQHSVAFFLESILKHYDKEQFDILAYSDNVTHDAITTRLRAYVSAWHDTANLNNTALATLIESEHIDILVDLAGHSHGNRQMVFAKKPAPVQLAYLGYPATTGLRSMDFRLTDAFADPPGMTEILHSETLLRLQPHFLCYQPPLDNPACNALPATRNGYITFGSFNNLAKVTPATLSNWASILDAVPNSRLIVKALAVSSPEMSARWREKLVAAGIAANRVTLIGYVESHREFLQLYHEVDIALDTFPYHGTTTTCDALWMGVPVITRAGDSHVSRVGVSLLNAVGLSECITDSAASYIAKATELASDLGRLATLRSDLRNTMSNSKLMDGLHHAQQMEQALRTAWQHWCAKQQPQFFSTHRTDGANSAMELTLPGHIQICVPPSIGDLTTYILMEQSDWFEPEIEFVRRFCRPGYRVVDVGAGYGVYALSAANPVGSRGHVTALETDPAKRCMLEESKRTNSFKQLDVATPATMSTDDTETVIDWLATLNSIAATRCDILRIDADIDALQFATASGPWLTTHSPLIMAFSQHKDTTPTKLIDAYAALGYGAYVLIPGLQQLSAYCDELSDPYRVNLFFAKPELATKLRQDGWLTQLLERDELGTLSPAATLAWHEHLARLPFSPAFSGLWNKTLTQRHTIPGWNTYTTALNYYVIAHSANTPDDKRIAWLSASIEALAEAIAIRSSAARLQTLARVSAELGLRRLAVQTLLALQQQFAGETTPDVTEPFLPVSSAAEMTTVEDSIGRWCLTSILEQHEKLANFSSYFADNDTFVLYRSLANSKLLSTELTRRYQLMGERFGVAIDTRVETAVSAPRKPKVAVLYQLAHSGGTTVSRALGCMSGHVLLSEINPCASVTDPLQQAAQWYDLVSPRELDNYRNKQQLNYRQTIELICNRAEQRKKQVILRDWSYIDFTPLPFAQVPRFQLSQRDCLGAKFELRETALVRHPLDMLLAADNGKLCQDAASLRRYLRGLRLFARQAADVGFCRFEDFCADPSRTLREVCDALDLHFDASFAVRYTSYTAVTDINVDQASLNNNQRSVRPPVTHALASLLRGNEDYMETVDILGYKSDV